MCVFGDLVLTQTQALHCPPPFLVRMFEGCLIPWLPLISAGTKNPVAGKPRSRRTLLASGQGRHKTGGEAGKVTSEKSMEQSITDYS